MARLALEGATLHDPRYRAIYEALLAGVAPDAVAGTLPGPVGELAAALRSEPNEIEDAEGTFQATVADIKLPALFLRVQFVRDRLDAGERDPALLRQEQELRQELQHLESAGRLGFKASRRWREGLRTPRSRKQPPPTEI